MTLVNPPRGERSRIRALLEVARHGKTTSARLFAWGELVCFPLSVSVVALLVITIAFKWAGFLAPAWWSRYALPMLLAGSIGYLTNYIAVQMLFQPYRATDAHWLRLITLSMWKQGLVPARKAELADAMGRQVAAKLLTPEMIAEEITLLVGGTLDDDRFRRNLRVRLGPILRHNLPAIINRFHPEVMSLLREGLSEAVSSENVGTFIEKVVDPWLNEKGNRDRLVDAAVTLLKAEVPNVVKLLRDVGLNRYKEQVSPFKRLVIGAAEWLAVLDWDKVRSALETLIAEKESRQRIAAGIGHMTSAIKDALSHPQMQPATEQFKERASDLFGEFLQRFLTEKLPAMSNRLVDTPGFWHWLSEEGLPAARPHIMSWIETDALQLIGERFDVTGRVKTAVNQMEVEALHRMIDDVSSQQLGAIQVLGFALGLAVGVPLALFL